MDSTVIETQTPAAVVLAIPEFPSLAKPEAPLDLRLRNQPSHPELEGELAVARAIQRSLLPKHFPVIPGFSLAGFCESAREVGGDFYDAISLEDQTLLLVVADVMGKGVPAALFAASLRMVIRSQAASSGSPAELLTRINHQMFGELSSVDMFITAQAAVVDMNRGLLRLASAGHCPLLATSRLGNTQVVAPAGIPLGIQPESGFDEEIVPLEECSNVLLYTDGLTETTDSSGVLFGQDRLADWLSQAALRHLPANFIKDALLSELGHFRGQADSRDDLTFIVLSGEAPVTRAKTA
jgi:serine phosphatase RsbU (regulator of sigma subunit)